MAKLYGEILSSALMTFDKSFARANGQPLDSTEVYYSLEDAKTYAASAGAYVGQKIVVIDESGVVSHYSIENAAGDLKELGTKPVGDMRSITVDAEGVVSVKDFGTGYYKYIPVEKNEDGSTKEGTGVYESTLTEGFAENLTPKVRLAANGGYEIAWYAPNTDTTEGVLDTVTGLTESLETLNGNVDKVEEDVTDLQESIYGEGGTAEAPAEGSIAANVNELLDTVGGEDDKLGEDVDTLWANVNDLKDRTSAIEEDYLTSADKEELAGKIDAIEVPVLGVAADDKVLTLGADKLISATVSMSYDEDAKAIKLYGKDNAELGSVDATPFIKDGMLHDVAYDADTNTLTFTWNTDAGTTSDTVVLSDIIEPYSAGNGLDLTENVFSVKLADGSESFLTITEEGVKLAGVADAIATAKSEAITDAEGKIATAKSEALTEAAADAESKANAAKEAAIADAATKYATTGALSGLETALDERLDALEAFDHETYATKEALKATDDKAVSNTTAIENLSGRIDDIVAEGGEPNQINNIKVNGVVQSIAEDKSVNIAVPTKFTDLTDDSGFDARITAAQKQADKGVNDAKAAADAAAQAQNEVDAVEKEVAGIQTTIAGHTTSISDHNTRIGLLEQADTTHATEYSELKTIVTNHTTEIAKKADNTALDAAIARIAVNEGAIKSINEVTISSINAEIAKKANAADVYAKTEIDAITGEIPEGKDIVTLIDEAKTAATYDDSSIKADIKANADAITLLNSDVNTAGSVKAEAKAAADIAVATVVDSAPEAMNTLKEVADWIANDESGAAAMATNIAANTTAIANINNATTGILAQANAYTDEAIAGLPAATAEALGLVKYDNVSIKKNEANQLYVAAVSTDLLVQGSESLILNGGSATASN